MAPRVVLGILAAATVLAASQEPVRAYAANGVCCLLHALGIFASSGSRTALEELRAKRVRRETVSGSSGGARRTWPLKPVCPLKPSP